MKAKNKGGKMQVEVEYVLISKKDYDIAIHILAEMFADFVKKHRKDASAIHKEENLPKNHIYYI